MLATIDATVIYPAAIIKVSAVKCRTLLDTGTGSSYASESLINLLNINQSGENTKQSQHKQI